MNEPLAIKSRAQTFLSGRFFLFSSTLIVFALAVFAWNTVGQTSLPRVEVVMISIEHGDSILIRSSKGDVALIDGGYPDAGTLDYLWEHDITHINTMIATHGHEDHIGGLPEVMRAIPVDHLIVNGQELHSTYFQEFESSYQELGIKPKIVRKGDRIPFGELTFRVISPAKLRTDSVNLNSIVLLFDIGEVTFMFTGDTEKPEENRLVHSYIPLHADILKVAHHAGNTSSDPVFLEKVNPDIAIYSASNYFPGFPNQDTIDTILLSGATVYGTNFNGDITIQTDGKTYSVQTDYGKPLLPYK